MTCPWYINSDKCHKWASEYKNKIEEMCRMGDFHPTSVIVMKDKMPTAADQACYCLQF